MPNVSEDSLHRLNALCGEALCWAQMFEQEIFNSILLHALVRGLVVSRDDVEELLNKKYKKKALRHKLNEIFQRIGTEPDLRHTLYEALEKRNTFVHDLFWEHAELLSTEHGREQLIPKARGYAELFRTAFQIARNVTALYAAQANNAEIQKAFNVTSGRNPPDAAFKIQS